jgi:outer membrane protein assembly factor BamB
VETVLWSFGGSGDGKQPYGALLIASDGYIYGVTSNGGSATNGVVFRY